MGKSRSFPERAEIALLTAMLVGIAMIAQRFNVDVFRWGLRLLVAATILQIAVGNLPKEASVLRSLVLTAAILCLVGLVFLAGIGLVPILSGLGR